MSRNRNLALALTLLWVVLVAGCARDARLLAGNHKSYIPLVQSGVETTIYGVENEGADWAPYEPYYPGMVLKISSHMARENPFQGVYNWTVLDRKANGHMGPMLLSIKGTAAWANGGAALCKLPLPIYYLPYLDYIDAVIERYQPRWVEIWNEPDTNFAGAEMYFGCLGDDAQAGQDYAVFVNMLANHIHAQHPGVTVLAGALMNPYYDFAKAFLGVPSQADGISFHYYAHCEETHNVDNFIEQLRTLTDIDLYFSETSLIYDQVSTACELEQARYASYLRQLEGVEMVIWYGGSYNGWYSSDLTDCCPIRLKLAYYAYTQKTK